MRSTWLVALVIVVGGSSETLACSCAVPGVGRVEVDCSGDVVLSCGGAPGSFELSEHPAAAPRLGSLQPDAAVAQLLSAPTSAGAGDWGSWLELGGRPLAQALSQPLARSLSRSPHSTDTRLRLRADLRARWSPLLSKLSGAR